MSDRIFKIQAPLDWRRDPARFVFRSQPHGRAGSAQTAILGELEFQGASKVEKTSGVWVDGQYVGYLGELKGKKKVLLLPGDHELIVRQAGYKDFTEKITVEPKVLRSFPSKCRKTERQLAHRDRGTES